MATDPTFRELQRFRQPWLWALLAGAGLLVLVLAPASILGLAVIGAVAALLYTLRLETEVRTDGVYVRMWPLHRSFRRFDWAGIERYEARRYRPIREFGGWGIRWAPGRVAYSVGGDRGVRIERSDGRDVLVGSRRPEALVAAMDAVAEGRD